MPLRPPRIPTARWRRRDLLALLGFTTAAAALPAHSATAAAGQRRPGSARPFEPVPLPLPLPSDGLSAAEQRARYRQVELYDRLSLPPGYHYDVLAAWGDALGHGRFGFNNDYLALLEQPGGRALLTVNFEYISLASWRAGYGEATDRDLPIGELQQALAARSGQVDVLALPEGDGLRQLAMAVAAAALEDLGMGVLQLQRQADGSWRRSPGPLERRITGLSGLEDARQRLRISGPAAAVLRAPERLGYDDGLADQIVGTFANCAGGQTPWGTVLSAEENIQDQVVEAVHADGSSPHPSSRPLVCDGRRLQGLGNPFALAGNKYGWMVELDPADPSRPAVKHSWLGRCRHEAVAIDARAGQPLRAYSGCDRHGGHLYRFVSAERIADPTDRRNSRLFEAGRLEAARFLPDGSGHWIPLQPQTPVAPLPPSHFQGYGLEQASLVPHSDRRRAGAERLATDADVERYRQRFPRLADLYPGEGERQQGAILIDAHLAANAVGATPAARPEDTELDPRSGDLLIAYTAGASTADGTADPAIFRGPAGEALWPYGWIMRLSPDAADPQRFRWRMEAAGGPPWQGGLGFSNPDNLRFDGAGNLWMVTDRSASAADLDLFGNNSCWVLPRRGAAQGQAWCFATGPMECELCGPCFDRGDRTLFLAVQHPGELHGTRRGEDQAEIQAHRLLDRRGQPFDQLRRVPLGSNWPSAVPGRPPRPAVVAIRRRDGRPLLPDS